GREQRLGIGGPIRHGAAGGAVRRPAVDEPGERGVGGGAREPRGAAHSVSRGWAEPQQGRIDDGLRGGESERSEVNGRHNVVVITTTLSTRLPQGCTHPAPRPPAPLTPPRPGSPCAVRSAPSEPPHRSVAGRGSSRAITRAQS